MASGQMLAAVLLVQYIGTGCEHLLIATAEDDAFEYISPGRFGGVTLLRTDSKGD